MKSIRQNWLLLLVLLTGALLRFYGFPRIPFTHDELSAWARTGYRSFGELIRQGVAFDGHPALIQVFLNYYRFLFGDSEAAFKLPFLVMGVLSIWWMYRLGTVWFGRSCGLLGAAAMAVTQIAVMHAQVARPYASGLFLVLVMAWAWWRFISEPDSRLLWRRGLWFVLLAALCCYNHYFSLLQAALIAITGLFLIPRNRRLGYLMACLAVVVLFAPHLALTLGHLDLGGVGGPGGWLARPTPDFFSDYLGYLSHFSFWFQAALVMVFVGSLATGWRLNPPSGMRWIVLLWGVLPALTGYVYSVLRNPVLQYSVLLFSLPFLVLWFFSFTSGWKPALTTAAVFAVLACGTYSLIADRQHFHLFYRQPIEQAVRLTTEYQRHSDEPVVAMLNHSPRYMSYYLPGESWDKGMIAWRNLNGLTQAQFRGWLGEQSAASVVSSNLPYEYVQVIRERFPQLQQRRAGILHDWYAFSSNAGPGLPLVYRADSLLPAAGYDTAAAAVADKGFVIDNVEYSPELRINPDSFVVHPDDWLVAAVRFSGLDSLAEAFLVISLWSGGRQQYWLGRPLQEGNDHGQGITYLALRRRDYPLSGPNREAKIYVWNKSRTNLKLQQLRIEAQAGNPWLYAVVEPVPPYAGAYSGYLSP